MLFAVLQHPMPPPAPHKPVLPSLRFIHESSRYRSPSWNSTASSASPSPALQVSPSESLSPVPTLQILASQALSSHPDSLINSIESLALSPAPSDAVINKEHGRKLENPDRIILLKICQNYARVYLNDKPQTQFWKLISTDFKKATGNPHKTLKRVVESIVKAQVEHIKECRTGTEPDGGDLNLAIDA